MVNEQQIIADREARKRADCTALDVALGNACDVSPEKWKAEQRDWLLAKLRALRDMWLSESEKQESYFCPDPEADRIAKGRTAGCARQLNFILEKML